MKSILVIISLLSCCISSIASTYYVDQNNLLPTPPYTNWITAATNIQDAVNQATSGDIVWVTNGTFDINQEISLPKGISLRSMQGNLVTIINAEGSSRCINMQSGSFLDGFKVTQGNISGDQRGAGILCADSSCIVSNCIITANKAPNGRGGGMSSGKVYDSQFTYNQAIYGGGIYYTEAHNCTMKGNRADYGAGFKNSTVYSCNITQNLASRDGGGGRDGTAINSLITYNRADGNGGGLANSGTTAKNCLIWRNICTREGGGIYIGSAINCTIVGNTSTWGDGGGIVRGSVYNSIVWNNNGGDNFSNYSYRTCSPNKTHGVNGNITNAPIFVNESGGNFYLSHSSPCIDAGSNLWVSISTDVQGNDRIFDRFSHRTNIVDMGAYEFISLPLEDLDRDGRNYEQELFDGTDPLDSNSCFRIELNLLDTNSVVVTWATVPERHYDFCVYSNSLIEKCHNIYTNISFTSNSYTDTLDHAESSRFYKVNINWP